MCPWPLVFSPMGRQGRSPIGTPHCHRSQTQGRPSSWGRQWPGYGHWRGREDDYICHMIRHVGTLAWGQGQVILCLLPRLIIFSVGGDDPLGVFWVVADDKTRVDQGYASLCPYVGAETGATYLVRISEVGDVIPLGA